MPKLTSNICARLYHHRRRRRHASRKLIDSRATPASVAGPVWRRVIGALDTIYLFMVRSKLKARREGQTPCVIVTGNTRLFIITRER